MGAASGTCDDSIASARIAVYINSLSLHRTRRCLSNRPAYTLAQMSFSVACLYAVCGHCGHFGVISLEMILKMGPQESVATAEAHLRCGRRHNEKTKLSRERPAVGDVLHLDGRDLMREPLHKRRASSQLSWMAQYFDCPWSFPVALRKSCELFRR